MQGERVRSLAYLAALRGVRSVSAGIIFVVFPYIAKEVLHLSLFSLGIIYATAGAATAALSIVVGYMADLLGRKSSLYVASALLVLTPLVMLVRMSVMTALASAILGGISATGAMGAGGVGGVVGPVQNVIVADLSEGTGRTRVISLISFMGSVAAAAGTLIGGYLGYRDELAISSLIAAGAMALIPPIRLPGVRARSMSMRSTRNALKFSVTGLMNGLTNGLTVPFIVPIFIYVYHAPRSLTSDVVTAASLLATSSMLAAPWLERRLGFLRSITITRALTIPIMLAFPFAGSFWAAAALYLTYPMLRVIAIPVQQSFLLELTPAEERGRVSGYNQGSRLLFSSVGTFAASPFFDTGSAPAVPMYSIPFLIYAGLMGLNVYMYWRFFSADEARLASRRSMPVVGE
ncbi:MAG: MFS transporter [Acidilobus sp.]